VETSGSLKKTLAFVFCDIAGTGEFMAREGDLVVSALFHTFFEHAGRIAGEFDRCSIKLFGDGFLATFENAGEALAFAASVQSQLSEDAVFRETGLKFRFSLHVGDALYVETSYGAEVLGDDVNLAARLNDLAEPGQIAISQAAIDQLPEDRRALVGPSEEAQIRRLGKVTFSRVSLVGT
jgi:adenylate cyclase